MRTWRLFRRGFVQEALLRFSCNISAADSESCAHRAEVTHRANGIAREDLVAARARDPGSLSKSVDSQVQTLQTLLEYS